VKAVTIHDTASVTLRDLGAQFYLTESDIGSNRAEACKNKLQELNNAVKVSAATGPLTDEFLSEFHVRAAPWPGLLLLVVLIHVQPVQVVVATDCTLAEALRIDEFCNAQSPAIAFIKAETRGVFASVFCDFGPAFTVYDTDGACPERAWRLTTTH
jgi:ubiquitin-activating enzyme E1